MAQVVEGADGFTAVDAGGPHGASQRLREPLRVDAPALLLVAEDELGSPDLPIGSTIYRGGDAPNLRVVDRLETPDDPESFSVLVVEAVT